MCSSDLGMWKSQISDDLVWKGQFEGMDFKIALDRYRSPGWSWISVIDQVPNRTVGCVKNDLRRRLYAGGQEENVAYYVDRTLQLAQADAPFGRVLSGKVTLRARTVPLGSTGPRVDITRLRKDCNYHLTEDEESRLELLLMKFCSRWSMSVMDEVEEGYASLILLRGDGGSFKRLGTYWAWSDAAAKQAKPMVDWENVEYREITLV